MDYTIVFDVGCLEFVVGGVVTPHPHPLAKNMLKKNKKNIK